MREPGSTVQTEARNADHRELDGQHVTFFPRREVPRCAVDRAHGRIGEGLGVESGCVLGVAIVPEANRVLCWLHVVRSPSRAGCMEIVDAMCAWPDAVIQLPPVAPTG